MFCIIILLLSFLFEWYTVHKNIIIIIIFIIIIIISIIINCFVVVVISNTWYRTHP